MEQRTPVLEEDKLEKPQLLSWLEKYSPDVLIAKLEFTDILAKFKIKIPQDVGLACYSLSGLTTASYPKVAGIEENGVMTGAAAVDPKFRRSSAEFRLKTTSTLPVTQTAKRLCSLVG